MSTWIRQDICLQYGTTYSGTFAKNSCISLLFFFSDYVKKYATEEALREQEEMSTSSESSMSDFSEDEAQDHGAITSRHASA